MTTPPSEDETMILSARALSERAGYDEFREVGWRVPAFAARNSTKLGKERKDDLKRGFL